MSSDAASTKGFSRKRSNHPPADPSRCTASLNEGLLSEEKQCLPGCSRSAQGSAPQRRASLGREAIVGSRRGRPDDRSASTKGFSRKRSNRRWIVRGHWTHQAPQRRASLGREAMFCHISVLLDQFVASTKGFSRKRSNLAQAEREWKSLRAKPQRRASLGREAIQTTSPVPVVLRRPQRRASLGREAIFNQHVVEDLVDSLNEGLLSEEKQSSICRRY